ncbi:MAG: cellulose synthase family protein [Planctomycetota bacterium JB042]
MAPWEQIVLTAYYAVLVILSIYGLHRYALVWLYYRTKDRAPRPAGRFSAPPKVCVQLPVFNEATVVERLIDAVCAFDWPRDRLEVQVLDDSTDETVEIARACVDRWRARGVDVVHLHRHDRTGFKAGALAAGMERTDADLLAIFDADFVPPPDLLRRTIDHFTDDGVGMVQVRWGHLNRRFSTLTYLQSVFLDGHFVIEHTARNRSGRFFNFNGTAGIWRRECIQEAGGWQHDTLTEDLDLSYRAQLRGWRFVFLPEVVSPAELPVEMNSFKSQQHRWAKGSIQTCRKLLPTIWRADVPLKAKVEATFHLTNNLAYLFMIALALLMLPAVLVRARALGSVSGLVFDLSIFVAATSSVLAFYAAAQREVYRDWKRTLLYFPALVALGIGISVNNAKAVVEALLGHESPFVRTPKYAVGERRDAGAGLFRYVGSRQRVGAIEFALAAYFVVLTGLAAANALWTTAFFLSLFLAGYLWVAIASLSRASPRLAAVA